MTRIAFGVSSGGSAGASADELLRLSNAEDNLGVNFLSDAIEDNLAISEVIDGFYDQYSDQTGVDGVTSTGETYTDAGAGGNSYYAGSAMVLVANSQTADTQPDTVRAVLFYDPQVAATLNTDCTFEVSRDGGTSWTTATLTKSGDYDANVEILTTGDIDISAQFAGTSMEYRYSNLNAKDQRLHGVYMTWR